MFSVRSRLTSTSSRPRYGRYGAVSRIASISQHKPLEIRTVCICLAFLCFLCSLSLADAQRLRFRSSGLVTFAPTTDVYLTELGDVIEPDPSSPNIRMRVDNARQYLFQIDPTARPSGAPELQARYIFSSRNGGSASTNWISLDRPLQGTVTSPDRRTEIEVAYRVRLTGQEVAGDYTTSITYRANNSPVQHDVRVVVPEATALRIDSSLVTAQTATINFDYGGDQLRAYLQAIETLTPLPATDSDIRTLEVFTNNPGGYTVTVGVTLDTPSPSGSLLAEHLFIAGQPAQGRRFTNASPTYGFQPLISPNDFSLLVDGSEEPGDYLFHLTYDAQANP